MIAQQSRDLIDQRRRRQRLIALQIHHNVVRVPALGTRDFCDAIGAGFMRAAFASHWNRKRAPPFQCAHRPSQ